MLACVLIMLARRRAFELALTRDLILGVGTELQGCEVDSAYRVAPESTSQPWSSVPTPKMRSLVRASSNARLHSVF
jgi:hypothetical protein